MILLLPRIKLVYINLILRRFFIFFKRSTIQWVPWSKFLKAMTWWLTMLLSFMLFWLVLLGLPRFSNCRLASVIFPFLRHSLQMTCQRSLCSLHILIFLILKSLSFVNVLSARYLKPTPDASIIYFIFFRCVFKVVCRPIKSYTEFNALQNILPFIWQNFQSLRGWKQHRD